MTNTKKAIYITITALLCIIIAILSICYDLGIVRIEIMILFLLSGINLLFALRRLMRENRYSYSIMYYVGALVFVVVNILIFAFQIVTDSSTDNNPKIVLNDVVNDATYFVYIMFPIIVILAIFLAVSNVVLILREGGRIRNFLGIGLGLFLIVFTLGMNHIVVFFEPGSKLAFVINTVIYALLAYFECVMIGTALVSLVTRTHVPKTNKDYMIILGCGLREDGTPIPLLQGRIDRALWFLNKQKKVNDKDLIFVCSGGQGDDEIISEAESMKNYLMSKGIAEKYILLEDKSTSTYENMKFSKEVIDNNRNTRDNAGVDVEGQNNIAFSTTSYHVFRSGNIAHSLGLDAEGIGSKTNWYFYTNALIREFVANINSERRRHITNSLIILLLCLIINAIYFVI